MGTTRSANPLSPCNGTDKAASESPTDERDAAFDDWLKHQQGNLTKRQTDIRKTQREHEFYWYQRDTQRPSEHTTLLEATELKPLTGVATWHMSDRQHARINSQAEYSVHPD